MNKLIKSLHPAALSALATKGKTSASVSLKIRALVSYAARMDDKTFDQIVATQAQAEAMEKIK
jgi:hypothetical protein